MANIKDDRQELVMNALRDQYLPPKAQSEVVLTDIDIPFGRVVSIMVKWMLATIPAVILAVILGGLIIYGLVFSLALLGVVVDPDIWTS